MLTKAEFIEHFERMGAHNRLVMLHSSFKSFGGVEGGAQTVVDALAEAVGPHGAAFFPTYGVSAWCGNHYWDLRETPSEMGAITEVARNDPRAYRTRHPIHSFAVIGGWRDAFEFDNRESYSDRGPFGLFHREDGLMISAGVTWSSTFSFVHYVENQENAPWRRVKNFSGIYVDSWGMPHLKTYSMSVRSSLGHTTRVDPIYDLLTEWGVVHHADVGASAVSWFDCQEYYDAVAPLVARTPDKFYEVKRWMP